MSTYGGWHIFWASWFLASFGSFLAVESYALCTDWHRTLSAAVWHLEDFVQDQPITQWSATHVLFVGVMFTLFVWLTGHFAMGWWR